MKKVISLFLTLVMVLSMLPVTAFAAETATISYEVYQTDEDGNRLEEIDLSVGKTISVTANIENNPGMASVTLGWKWNDKVVKFTGFTMQAKKPKKLESDLFGSESPVLNTTLAILSWAAGDYNVEDDGSIFTANFEIIAGGELGIGINVSDDPAVFNMKYWDLPDDPKGKLVWVEYTIDSSALEGLVAEGPAAAPDLPEELTDLAVSKIVTDKGDIVAIEYADEIAVSPWGEGSGSYNTPRFHVTLPAGATETYVTIDLPYTKMQYNTEQVDGVSVPSAVAGAYGGVNTEGGGMTSFAYKEKGEDYTVFTVPTEVMGGMWGSGEPISLLKYDNEAYYAAGPENSSATPIFVLSFEYEDGSGPIEPPHTCTYDQEVVADKYLKSEATCQSATVYYKSCQCGEFAETAETFTSGTAVEHSFGENGKCQWCETYTITVAASENGTVTATQYAEAGSTVTLTVAPVDGYMLDVLSVMNGETAVEVAEGYTFTMPAAPVNVSATFKVIPPESYTVTVEESENGTVIADPTAAAQGATVTLTVTPDEGYKLATLTVMAGETAVEVAENNTFEMPAANVTVTATFEKIPTYAITIDETIVGGTVTVTNEDGETITEAAEGDLVMISATPDEGYKLMGVTYTVEGREPTNSENNAFDMPAAPVTVSAVFVSTAPEVVPNPITKIEVSHPSIKTEDGKMTMDMVVGASETIDLSFAVADANLEATQIVYWSSSNTEAATVDQNGKITAVGAGTTTITAKAVDASGVAPAAEDDEVLAAIELTVSAPAAGYTVNMGPDKTVVANETIQIPVTVTHIDTAVENYKSYEFTFQYDPELLTLNNKSAENDAKDVTIEGDNGTVTVRRYGEALNVGVAAITLEFSAKNTCETSVILTSAKVGTSADAQDQNIPVAQIVDGITLVTVSGYTVNLPTAFDGKTVVAPGAAYTFQAKDKNYTYTVKATIDGNEITVTPNEDGTSFTIAEGVINGNVTIEVVTETGKKFDVAITENADLAPAEGFTVGEDAAQYMVDYKAVLTPASSYEYGVNITIGTEEYPCTPDDNNVYTIAGSAITGDINITVTKNPVSVAEHNVRFSGNGVEDLVAGYAVKVAHNGTYTFSLNEAENFAYTVTASMGGTAVTPVKAEAANEDGSYTYTIANVTADLAIQIEKSDLKVAVSEYVGLDGKTVFLVTATQTLPEGKTLAYGGSAMYLKSFQVEGSEEMVQKYSWLVEVGENETLTVESATAQIAVTEATSTVLEQTYNVNESSALDINDAQLVYDLYNNVYQSIATVGMQKFLRADVNGSGNINVSDAAAVVSAIIAEK